MKRNCWLLGKNVLLLALIGHTYEHVHTHITDTHKDTKTHTHTHTHTNCAVGYKVGIQ